MSTNRGPLTQLRGRATWKARQVTTAGRERVTGLRRRLPRAGEVALSFDDGPDPVHTPILLDALHDLDAHATFFCVGAQVRAHPEIVERMVREGHRVGSHSATHPEVPDVGFGALVEDFRDGRRALEDVVGARATLFRPPKGHAAPRTLAAMRAAGLRGWLWSVDPEDYVPGQSATHIAVAASAAKGRDVVLLHDGLFQPWDDAARDRSATLEAVPIVVRELRAKGLRLVTLP